MRERLSYQSITEKFIAKLKEGVVPWKKPWFSHMPQNFITGRKYKGINLLLLHNNEYPHPFWITVNQGKKNGIWVNDIRNPTSIIYWNWTKKDIDERDTGDDKQIWVPFLKTYYVYNVAQCKIEGKWKEKLDEMTVRNAENPILECESIIENMPDKPEIAVGPQASYSLLADKVTMPARESFSSMEEFYSIHFHELVHSTAHKTRLNRKLATQRDMETYSREELVAEIGASFLCGRTNILPKTEDNSASYLQAWIEKLQNDTRLIAIAANQAGKAADFIMGEYDPEQSKG